MQANEIQFLNEVVTQKESQIFWLMVALVVSLLFNATLYIIAKVSAADVCEVEAELSQIESVVASRDARIRQLSESLAELKYKEDRSEKPN